MRVGRRKNKNKYKDENQKPKLVSLIIKFLNAIKF